MPIIAIVNRKGGSGKSTLATHVATWFAHRGEPAMLGDVDRQHSCTQWLARRRAQALPVPALSGWAVDPQRVLRPPSGTTHVVLDTPGGLHGYELTRLLAHADVVLLPVCDAAFDLESAAQCLAELRAHPRMAAGRVRLAAVGMRTESRSRSEQRLREWATAHAVEWLGAIPAAAVYPYCAAEGLAVFDLPDGRAGAAIGHWQPVMDRLDGLLAQHAASRLRPQRPNDAQAPLRRLAITPDRPHGLGPTSTAPRLGAGIVALSGVSAVSGSASAGLRAPLRAAPARAGLLAWLGELWSPASRRSQALHR